MAKKVKVLVDQLVPEFNSQDFYGDRRETVITSQPLTLQVHMYTHKMNKWK